MPPITAPDYSKSAGIPSQWSQEFLPTAEGFVVGDNPSIVTEDLPVKLGQTIAARTAVGFDSNGLLVPAVKGTTPAIGFTIVDIVTTTAAKSTPVYRAGVFNPALGVFDASYATLADKIAAFRGAPTPTNIIMRPVKQKPVPQP